MTSMSRARVARRIAAGAAYGGGGIGLVSAAAVGLVLAEVRMAKRQVGNGRSPHAPSADGLYGRGYATPVNLRSDSYCWVTPRRPARASTGPVRRRAR